MPLFRSETIAADRDVDGSLHLTIDVAASGVNVLGRQALADLDQALDAVAEASRTPLLVIRSGKKSGFVAGADIGELAAISDAAGAESFSALGQKVFARLAALPMPTLAAISGACLGGGLELALACDYRLIFDRPGTQLGLPEVELGLLPAWGGTQRLPRVIGLERALQMIVGGKRLDARTALAWGLADGIAVAEGELREQFSALALLAAARGKRPRRRLPLHSWRQRLLESTGLGRRLIWRATRRLLMRRAPEDMPAPFEACEAIRIGLAQGIDAGLAQERAAAGRLAASTACRNLVALWLQTEKSRKLPEGLAAQARQVQRVGVVGAGVMGAGIAQLAAIKGLDVFIQEINRDALEAGKARVTDLFEKAVQRGVLSAAEARQREAAMRWTLSWEGFPSVDVVIEAAVEELSLKKKVFAELAARTPPEAILATNTSSLTVGALQEDMPGAERVAGMHFFNPVHKMRLVEVVGAPATQEQATATLARLAIVLGKVPVIVGDGPGFVVNRVLVPYLGEAVRLVAEGLGIAAIDRTMKRFGMPMGPLEVLDQVGLDVAAHVARSTASVFAERFGSSDALERMRQAGLLGQKSGKGFYLYKGKRPQPNPAAEALLRQGAPPSMVPALPEAARIAEARERLVLLSINEAALALSEGLAEDVSTIDLALVLGAGWAPHRGGPLHYADDRGLNDVITTMAGLAARHGRRFEPCDELRRRAGNGMRLVAHPSADAAGQG